MGRSTEKITGLMRFVKDFKQNAQRIFENHEASKLCTSKYHVLAHLAGDTLQIKQVDPLSSSL